METQQVVRIVNPTDEDVDWRWDGVRYPIRAGGEQIVPWGAMCVYLGNPNSRDIDSKNRNRTRELARLRVKYGAYEKEEAWERNRPHLEAWMIDGSDRITTVIDDPYAEPFDPSESELTEVELLRRRQLALEDELKALHAKLGMAEAADEAPNLEPDQSPRRPAREVEEPPPIVPQPGPSADDRYSEPEADPSTQQAEPDAPQAVPVGDSPVRRRSS